MSAALAQLKGIIGSGFPGLAEYILAQHAHEMAETIRQSVTGNEVCVSQVDGAWHAADLIDPEAAT